MGVVIKRVTFLIFAYIFSVLYFPLEVSGTSLLTKLMPLVLLSVSVFACLLTNKKVYLSRNALNFFIFQLLMLLSVILNGGNMIFFANFFFLSLFVLLFYGTYLKSEREAVTIKLFKAVVVFASVASIVALMNYYFYDQSIKLFLVRSTPYFASKGQVGSFYPNPNLFGNMIAISSAIAVLLYRSNNISMVRFSINMILILIGIICSGSRMSLAVYSLALVYLFTPESLFNRFRKGRLFLYLFLILSSSSFLFYLLAGYIDLNFRDVIWGSVIEVISINYIWGIGLANLPETLHQVNSSILVGQAANNFVLGFIAENGVLCFMFLFIYFYFSFNGNDNRNKRGSSCSFEVIFCFMLLSQFAESFYSYVGSYVILMMVCLVSSESQVKSLKI